MKKDWSIQSVSSQHFGIWKYQNVEMSKHSCMKSLFRPSFCYSTLSQLISPISDYSVLYDSVCYCLLFIDTVLFCSLQDYIYTNLLDIAQAGSGQCDESPLICVHLCFSLQSLQQLCQFKDCNYAVPQHVIESMPIPWLCQSWCHNYADSTPILLPENSKVAAIGPI